jgi:transposase
MSKEIVLSKRENARVRALSNAQCAGSKNKEIAESLRLSVRQVQRLKKALREEGPAGLAHGNRGAEAAHATPEELVVRVVELYRGKYAGFNFSHFHEKLLEVEGVEISRSSVGRVLKSAGFVSPRKRRPPKHRSRRERRACEGAMIQIDGSPHDWLEGRGERLCLIGGIDDATGKVVGAIFRGHEDAQGYFLMMRQVLRHGIPETVYHDRHGIFVRDVKEGDALWEQLEGKRASTQFGRLMEELEVRQIEAGSPQAKGRIERLWGTFQDRLVSELRLTGARSLEEANEVLKTVVVAHNNKFHRRPQDPVSVYRKPDKGLDLESLFCFKYKRSVANDNTVSFFGRTIQIGPGPGGKSYASRWVDVHERFDGSVHIYYQDLCLAKVPPPPIPPSVIRVRNNNGRYAEECPWSAPRETKANQSKPKDPQPTQREPNKPAPNHPWRRAWVTESRNS